MSLRHYIALVSTCIFIAADASASELGYTFMDFRYLNKTVEAQGLQFPVPIQSIEVITDTGDGISIEGSLGIRENFFIAGSFQSSIVALSAEITNPFVTRMEDDEFDLIQSRVSFGYIHQFGANFDLIIEASYDSSDYDFGSLAGEDFDMTDSGAGAQIGFRWNPTPAFELSAAGRYTQLGTPLLSTKEFESDTLFRLGIMWYFFEDLGLGIEAEVGEIDTVSISMRFGFGDLPW